MRLHSPFVARFASFTNLFALLAVCGGLLGSPIASAQHTSVQCPAQTATVTAGGTVTINITACTSNIAFAGIGDIDNGSYGAADPENHGVATQRITGGQWFLDYTHNDTTGIGSTDVFEFTDGDGNGDVQVTITINPSASPITVSPASLPTLTAGTAFSQALSSSGGLAPYTYTLQGGSLPIGVTLSAGVLSGTPTQRGAYNFSVRSTDSTTPTAQFVDRAYGGTVQNPSLAFAVNTGTAGQGIPFSQTLTVNGGVAPHTCLLETGTFPAGISVSSACVVSGTTSAAPGSFPVTIRVTDASTGPGSYFELESYTLTVSVLPNLTINDVALNEGNSSTTNFTFTVNLSAPAPAGGVTFDIATSNGTATAGSDYVANSLTGQTIPAGSSSYSFTVQVNGDTLNEASETFFVNVTNVVGAIVVDGQGVGTINNDDPPPSLSINDVTVVEGNAGTVNAVFTVTLSAASGQTVTVNFATADGTATQPADYTSNSGTLTFTPGQTTQTITVPVIGETLPEANETFFVNLSGATNATISDTQGVGTITNDDVPVTVSPATVPNGTVGVAYSQTITASGGTGAYSFTVSSGALPTGLTLSPSGAISGTPTVFGTYNFNVTATDSSPSPGPFTGVRGYTISIAQGTQTVTFTPATPVTFGVAPITLTASATSGLTAFTFSTTAAASICTVAGNQLTITGAGSCPLTATQPGNANFLPASANATVVINAASQTVTFTPTTPVNFATGPYTLTALASSGLTTFTFATTAAASVCTVAGNQLTIVGIGNCPLTATQPGNASFLSASANATVVINPVAPGAPTIGVATPGNGQANIAFTPPASDGGSPITSYTVSCSPGSFTGTGAASPVTVTGLTNGTTYTCTVIANNVAGPSTPSGSVTVTPRTVPGAPTIGAATLAVGQATIAFTPPTSDGGSAITGYTARCVGVFGTVSASGTGSPIVVTGLINGMLYQCTVVANNAAGESAASAAVVVDLPALPVPLNVGVWLIALLMAAAALGVRRGRRSSR